MIDSDPNVRPVRSSLKVEKPTPVPDINSPANIFNTMYRTLQMGGSKKR